jgi:hypothetical protein
MGGGVGIRFFEGLNFRDYCQPLAQPKECVEYWLGINTEKLLLYSNKFGIFMGFYFYMCEHAEWPSDFKKWIDETDIAMFYLEILGQLGLQVESNFKAELNKVKRNNKFNIDKDIYEISKKKQNDCLILDSEKIKHIEDKYKQTQYFKRIDYINKYAHKE